MRRRVPSPAQVRAWGERWRTAAEARPGGPDDPVTARAPHPDAAQPHPDAAQPHPEAPQHLDAAPQSRGDAHQHPDGAHPAPRAELAVPYGLRVAAAWVWRLAVVGAGAYLLFRVLARVPLVTVPFVLALLLTAVLGPIARWLGRRLPRSLACFLAVVFGIAAFGGLGTFVGMQIGANSGRLSEQFTLFVRRANEWLRTGPLHLTDTQVEKALDDLAATLTRDQAALFDQAVSTVSTASEVLAGLLLMLLSTFFLLRDGRGIWGWALSLAPLHRRPQIDRMAREGWHTLGGYVRGVMIIAALHAATVFVVLLVLKVPLALALSMVIFVASFIPMLGMTIAGTFCVLVAMIENGFGAATVVGLTILVLIQLEAHLLQPLIMSRVVELHPLAVALSVIGGTTLAGIPGALFAVPLVAFVNATVRAIHAPPGAALP